MSGAVVILIVDDDPHGCEALKGLLSDQGYQLAFAGSGQEALQKATHLTPDLIILDFSMPDMDGFEVTRKLRADPYLAEVPVMMITSIDDHEARNQGIEAGADDFITKPFKRVELRARIKTITRLNRYRRLLVERAQFDWVLEKADDGYLMINSDDEITYANSRARMYLNIPEEKKDLSSEKFLKLAKKIYKCEPEEAWNDWPSREAMKTSRKRYLVKQEKHTSSARWLKVDVNERSVGQEIHWLVRLLEVTAEMTSKRNIWTFERMLSHKLRVPLEAMRVPVELLANEEVDLTRKETLEYSKTALINLERIKSEIAEIDKYLNNPIIAYSDSGFKISRIESIISQICQDLRFGPPEAVKLSIQDEIKDVNTVISAEAIDLIMWELLDNAQKFHPSRSAEVEIVITQIKVDMVRIQVKDNGVYLTSDQIARAWMPHYKGDRISSGQSSSKGLGLSVVESLLWQIGGACRLFNREPGPGIIVELDIPIPLSV